jgi:muramoyltetrapeptide carboxypeptidase
MAQLKANALKQGDVIGIIAPASPPRFAERVKKSVAYFERLGYQVELGKHLNDNVSKPQFGYLSASDKDRLSDLHAMIRNKHVKAILFHRGGFGSIRMLDQIDYDLVRRNPKIFVGYSDATAMFAALHKKSRLSSCFFGPMPGVDLWDTIDSFTEEHFWRALTSPMAIGELTVGRAEGKTLFKAKAAQGTMIGGNLTVFNSLLGTPYQPSFSGGIIPFFEDIDEKPRRIDALFAQLRLAGMFDRSKAILLGQFTNCDSDADAPTRSLQDIFKDYFGKLDVPVISQLPFGHESRKWTIAYGAHLRIQATPGGAKIEVLDSALLKE